MSIQILERVSIMPKYYDLEYREYVCRLVLEEDRVIAELARELNIAPGTISRWLKEFKMKTGWVDKHQELKEKQAHAMDQSYKTPTDYEKELKEQHKQLQQLKEENAFLKKAMHVFTQSRE